MANRIFFILYKSFSKLHRTLTGKIRSRSLQFYLKSRNVDLGDGCKFIGNAIISIHRNSTVRFGKEFICRSGDMEAIDPGRTKIVVNEGAVIKFGDYSGISNTTIYCYNNIEIGNHVNIGANCLIMDSNFHSTDWRQRLDRKVDVKNAKTAPVKIGDCSFIGARSIITKGVTIGQHSMVSAGSVVVRDIPDDEMWGGNPAVFIKKMV